MSVYLRFLSPRFLFAVLCLVFPFSYEQNLTSRTHFFTSAPLMRQTYIKFVLKVERVKNLIKVYKGLLEAKNRGEWNENARKGIEKGELPVRTVEIPARGKNL